MSRSRFHLINILMLIFRQGHGHWRHCCLKHQQKLSVIQDDTLLQDRWEFTIPGQIYIMLTFNLEVFLFHDIGNSTKWELNIVFVIQSTVIFSLQSWHEHHGVSNHQQKDSYFNNFNSSSWQRHQSSSLLAPLDGNPHTCVFPWQRVSNAESVSILLRHHIWIFVSMSSVISKDFPRYWSFVNGIHRSLVDSPRHKGQWRRPSIFSVIWAWTNGWTNDGDAGDLRRHRAHYVVTVMQRHTGKDVTSVRSQSWHRVDFKLVLACYIMFTSTSSPHWLTEVVFTRRLSQSDCWRSAKRSLKYALVMGRVTKFFA